MTPHEPSQLYIRHTPPGDGGSDRDWVAELWQREWDGLTMVTCGRVHRLVDLDILVAHDRGVPVGAAAYRRTPDGCELASLNAMQRSSGVGTALLAAVEDAAREFGALRVWLITTNDNLAALRFYQRRGYRLVAVHAGAVDVARTLKPAIPLVGADGIPLHDELELEKRMQPVCA